MSTQGALNNHELENAFSTFNGLSEQLSMTYKLLVSQVENLESELDPLPQYDLRGAGKWRIMVAATQVG